MTSTDTTKLPDVFDFEVGPEKVKFSIPAAQLKDAKAIFTRNASSVRILDNIGIVNMLLKTCDPLAFGTFAGWLGDKKMSIFDMDSAPKGEEQTGWITLIKLAHVAEVMGCDKFDCKVNVAMKSFCMSREGNFPNSDTIRLAEKAITTENNSIWVAFAMAWIYHHPSTTEINETDGYILYYDIETDDVPHILSFFLVKMLRKLTDPDVRQDQIAESWKI